MDNQMIAAAAREIATLLGNRLADYGADHVMLSRDEALLAQGLLEGLAEELERRSPKPS